MLTRYYNHECDCDTDQDSNSSTQGQSEFEAAGPSTSVMSRLLADEADMEEGEIDQVGRHMGGNFTHTHSLTFKILVAQPPSMWTQDSARSEAQSGSMVLQQQHRQGGPSKANVNFDC